MNINNINQDANSLQVSKLYNVPAGNWSLPDGAYPALIKNITGDEVKVQVKLYKGEDFISTVLYPGWNPELIIAIKNAPSNTFQYGN